jgi:hypothetical protein
MDIDTYMQRLEKNAVKRRKVGSKSFQINNHMYKLNKKAMSYYEEKYEMKLGEV